MSGRQGFGELQQNVVAEERCTGCGACFASCPFENTLDYSEGAPRLVGECKNCGICLRVCPRYRVDIAELDKLVFGRGRTSEEPFGIHLSLHIAKALDPRVKAAGQDGGVATALLVNALDNGLIDGAVVSATEATQPWLPVPRIARSREEVLGAGGTRYSYSPGILALKKIVSGQLRQVAFVGPPCQVIALRRMQRLSLKRAAPISPVLGLFCSESFSYEGLILGKIQKGMGIDPSDIEKMNIKGRMQIILKDGRIVEIPLKEARSYAESYCRFCPDFSAEFADISLGGVGLDGRTFTVVRTERGEKFLDAAVSSGSLELRPVEEFKSAYDLMIRLSASKRGRAQGTA